MEGDKRIAIYEGLKGEVVFDVDAEGETIWATQAQMSNLFGVDRTVIGRHLRNIFNEGELDEKVACAKNTHTTQHGAMTGKTQVHEVKTYNLDAIISVGYRVNSKKATKFRIWATSVLKQYLNNGVAVNERRLAALAERREIKKLHDVEDMMAIVRRLTTRSELDAGEANGIIEVISRYAGSFKTLEEYDDGHIDLSFMSARRKQRELTIDTCMVLRVNAVFDVERVLEVTTKPAVKVVFVVFVVAFGFVNVGRFVYNFARVEVVATLRHSFKRQSNAVYLFFQLFLCCHLKSSFRLFKGLSPPPSTVIQSTAAFRACQSA